MAAREASEAELGLVHRSDPGQATYPGGHRSQPRTWAPLGLPAPHKQCLSPMCLSFTIGWVGEGAMRWAVPPRVCPSFPLLSIHVSDPALPACSSAAQSTWPCCGGPRPWARGSFRHCLDSMMPSTSIRCVPWGHTHPPRNTCLFTPMAARPGQSPQVHGPANTLHTCWLPLLAPGMILAHSIQRLVPCSLAQGWAESEV